MKHIHKYIFATIIILLLTSTVQSAPKAFDSLGNELEVLQKDCKQCLKDPKISKKLKAKCEKFNAKVNKAFKVGYPLDDSVDNNTAGEKKLNHYLALLLEADESEESLRKLIRSQEKKKAKEKKAKFDKQINEYRKACDGGDAKVCYTFGVIFYVGQGVKQDYKEAAKLFRKACDNGNAKGCYDLGCMQDDGQGVKKNHEEAARLFGKACDGGHAEGCKNYEMIQNDAKLKQLREEQIIKRSKEKAEERRKFHEKYPYLKDEQRKERQAKKERERKEKVKKLALAHKTNRNSSATNNMTYRAYKVQRVTKPMNFTVSAWMGSYFNFEFRDEYSRFYNIKMETSTDTIDGYVRIKSDTGRRIFEILKDGYAHKITVKIHFPSKKGWEWNYVVIDKLIAKD